MTVSALIPQPGPDVNTDPLSVRRCMREQGPSVIPAVRVHERLDSWKQIALYLNREVRTVQRWKKHEGLPVHQHFHRKGRTVYAFRHEIDLWLKSRRRLEDSVGSSGLVEHSAQAAIALTSSPSVLRSFLTLTVTGDRFDCAGFAINQSAPLRIHPRTEKAALLLSRRLGESNSSGVLRERDPASRAASKAKQTCYTGAHR